MYVATSRNEKGSPVEVEIVKNVRVKQIRNFSMNYYSVNGTNQRSMRNSRNFVVSKDLTKDIIQDGLRYEPLYVVYDGIKYHIKEILNYYKSALRMILDTEEVR